MSGVVSSLFKAMLMTRSLSTDSKPKLWVLHAKARCAARSRTLVMNLGFTQMGFRGLGV